jgi:hypothetical protein
MKIIIEILENKKKEEIYSNLNKRNKIKLIVFIFSYKISCISVFIIYYKKSPIMYFVFLNIFSLKIRNCKKILVFLHIYNGMMQDRKRKEEKEK